MCLAQVLADVDPAFSTTTAIECLWDCEPESRRIGVVHAAPTDARVRTRVQEIAADEAEDGDVRDAATESCETMAEGS